MTIFVKDKVEIPGDSWVTYTTEGHEVVQQPNTMNAEQMVSAGVSTVEEAPMPDPFYGPVEKDPNNPGQWIQTPYTPDEMKPILEEYSGQLRLAYETANIIVHSTSGNYGLSTLRDDRFAYESGYHYLTAKDTGGVNSIALKMWAVEQIDPPTYGKQMFMRADTNKMTEVKNALNKWSELCFSQEHTLHDSIEAGSTTTKEQIKDAYLTMRSSAFPIM